MTYTQIRLENKTLSQLQAKVKLYTVGGRGEPSTWEYPLEPLQHLKPQVHEVDKQIYKYELTIEENVPGSRMRKIRGHVVWSAIPAIAGGAAGGLLSDAVAGASTVGLSSL